MCLSVCSPAGDILQMGWDEKASSAAECCDLCHNYKAKGYRPRCNGEQYQIWYHYHSPMLCAILRQHQVPFSRNSAFAALRSFSPFWSCIFPSLLLSPPTFPPLSYLSSSSSQQMLPKSSVTTLQISIGESCIHTAIKHCIPSTAVHCHAQHAMLSQALWSNATITGKISRSAWIVWGEWICRAWWHWQVFNSLSCALVELHQCAYSQQTTRSLLSTTHKVQIIYLACRLGVLWWGWLPW